MFNNFILKVWQCLNLQHKKVVSVNSVVTLQPDLKSVER